MTQPTVKVLGAYKVEITGEEIKKFLEESFGSTLTPGELEEQLVLT
jgi:hypothetical protein